MADESDTRVVHPHSTFRRWWLLLMVVATLINVVVVPLSVSFLPEELHRSGLWLAVTVLTDGLFLADLVLNFRIGFETGTDPHVILDRARIRIHYLRTWFVVDLLAVLPLDHCVLLADLGLGLDLGTAALTGPRMLRLLRVSRLVRYVHKWEKMTGLEAGSIGTSLKLTHMLVGGLLAAHWNACIQFLIAKLRDFPGNCWVVLDKLMDKSIEHQYSKSMLRAVFQMTSFNVGSLGVPQGAVELWVAIVSIVLGRVLLAVTLARTLAQFKQTSASELGYQKKHRRLMTLLRRQRLPAEQRFGVAKQLRTRYQEDTVLDSLSESLRRDVMRYKRVHLMANAPIFKAVSPSLLDDIEQVLVFKVVYKNDLIMSKGEPGRGLYLLQRGAVKLEKTDHIVAVLFDGSFFGELCLDPSPGTPGASAVALTTCSLYLLSNRDYRRVLKRGESG